MKKLDPEACMVESRRQAGGRNGGLQGGQRVRHEMFEEVARSQSLHLLWPRTVMRRVWSPGKTSWTKERWSWEMRAQQRCRHYIRTQYLIAAGGVQFCLLCCQPEPVPRSLSARSSQLTLQSHCRPPVWL